MVCVVAVVGVGTVAVGTVVASHAVIVVAVHVVGHETVVAAGVVGHAVAVVVVVVGVGVVGCEATGVESQNLNHRVPGDGGFGMVVGVLGAVVHQTVPSSGENHFLGWVPAVIVHPRVFGCKVWVAAAVGGFAGWCWPKVAHPPAN